MAGYYQFQTVDLEITIHSEDAEKPLEDYRQIVVSLDQGGGRGNYHGDYIFDAGAPEVDVENSVINLSLSQEESGKYNSGKADVQVNILYDNAERNVTVMGRVDVKRNLYREVMP